MSWIQTNSGRHFDYINPSADSININDIAHALSKNCRFNGHVLGHYSVAEHCVVMSQVVSEKAKIYALMHDSAEAYLGDLPSPLKQLLPGFRELETKIRSVIDIRYNIKPPTDEIRAEIKNADLAMLYVEKQQALAVKDVEWECFRNYKLPKEFKDIYLKWWEPITAKKEFLDRFLTLI